MKRLSDIDLAGAVGTPPPAKEGTLIPAAKRKAEHYISKRAQEVWDRLIDWYGVSKMADFGEWPGVDFCRVIDSIRTRDDMGTFLANIRGLHPSWPPTFAQVEEIAKSLVVPSVDWNVLNHRLCEHVLATRNLTRLQIAGKPPWTFSPVGVYIPADGNVAGMFVGRDEVS